MAPGFLAVFAVFVVAFLVLCVVTMRWAVRRDRSGRQEWLRRRRAQMAAPLDPGRDLLREPEGGRPARGKEKGATSNGRAPGPSR